MILKKTKQKETAIWYEKPFNIFYGIGYYSALLTNQNEEFNSDVICTS